MNKKLILNSLIFNGGKGSGNFAPGEGKGVGKPHSDGNSKGSGNHSSGQEKSAGKSDNKESHSSSSKSVSYSGTSSSANPTNRRRIEELKSENQKQLEELKKIGESRWVDDKATNIYHNYNNAADKITKNTFLMLEADDNFQNDFIKAVKEKAGVDIENLSFNGEDSRAFPQDPGNILYSDAKYKGKTTYKADNWIEIGEDKDYHTVKKKVGAEGQSNFEKASGGTVSWIDNKGRKDFDKVGQVDAVVKIRSNEVDINDSFKNYESDMLRVRYDGFNGTYSIEDLRKKN